MRINILTFYKTKKKNIIKIYQQQVLFFYANFNPFY